MFCCRTRENSVDVLKSWIKFSICRRCYNSMNWIKQKLCSHIITDQPTNHSTNQPTNQPSPGKTAAFEKLVVLQLATKLCKFCGTRRFVTLLSLSMSLVDEEHKSWSANFCMFYLLHVTSSVVATSIFLSTLFSNTSVVTTNLEWIKLGYVYKLTLSSVAARASQRTVQVFSFR